MDSSSYDPRSINQSYVQRTTNKNSRMGSMGLGAEDLNQRLQRQLTINPKSVEHGRRNNNLQRTNSRASRGQDNQVRDFEGDYPPRRVNTMYLKSGHFIPRAPRNDRNPMDSSSRVQLTPPQQKIQQTMSNKGIAPIQQNQRLGNVGSSSKAAKTMQQHTSHGSSSNSGPSKVLSQTIKQQKTSTSSSSWVVKGKMADNNVPSQTMKQQKPSEEPRNSGVSNEERVDYDAQSEIMQQQKPSEISSISDLSKEKMVDYDMPSQTMKQQQPTEPSTKSGKGECNTMGLMGIPLFLPGDVNWAYAPTKNPYMDMSSSPTIYDLMEIHSNNYRNSTTIATNTSSNFGSSRGSINSTTTPQPAQNYRYYSGNFVNIPNDPPTSQFLPTPQGMVANQDIMSHRPENVAEGWNFFLPKDMFD